MSNAMTAACRSLQMPPTAKAVLMALADRANDAGETWPSIDTLMVDTCFSKRAVITAIQWLESSHLLRANRSNGRHTTYAVTPETFDRCTSSTSAADAPVHLSHTTGAPPAPDRCTSSTQPVRQMHSNHKEPSRTQKRSNPKVRAILALPDWLPADAWAEWVQHRREKSAKGWTSGAQKRSIADLSKLRDKGIDPVAVIDNAIRNGWSGLYEPRAGPPTSGSARPSARQSISDKTFQGDSDDRIEHLFRSRAA